VTFWEANDILSVFSFSYNSNLADSDDSGFSIKESRQNRNNLLSNCYSNFIYAHCENSVLNYENISKTHEAMINPVFFLCLIEDEYTKLKTCATMHLKLLFD
jgi:hypothetical protein